MLINYLTVAFRNILKYKIFSFINILGMAISLASCLLIVLFVYDEIRYDDFHPDGDRTFRVYLKRTSGQEVNYYPIVPYPFASYMKKDFPEIESTLRMMDTYGERQFERNGEQLLEGNGVFAESSVFDMLTLRVLGGDARKSLDEPKTVALSETMAKKYFGEKNAVGESVMINFEPWKVTAVYADTPENSHLRLNYILSFATTQSERHENNWQFQQYFTYLKLKPGTDASALEDKFLPFVRKYAYPSIEPKGFTYIPYIQNIQDIHLKSSQFEWEIAQRGNAQTVYILAGAAVLILVIASLNFVNLSTARAMKRMKEVGIRKVVGAARKQLIVQFMAESVLFALAGFILAIVIAQSSLTYLNVMVEKNLTLPFGAGYIGGEILLCVVLGVLAGSYPAFYLSRFRPVSVLTTKNPSRAGNSTFRESLVVLQFMFSFFLICASSIILSQLDFVKNKNLGFNKDHVIVVPLTRDQLVRQEVTKRKYRDNPNVISATIGFGLPGDIIAGDEIKNPGDGKTHPARLFCVDFDYIKTLQLKIVAGREFSLDFPSDSTHAFILNETAVSTYGLGTPAEAIGKPLEWRQWHDGKPKNGTVIGVVHDFNFSSLREKITPTVLHIYPNPAWKMAVRVKPDHLAETLAHLEKTYQSLESRWTFTYKFLDQNFDEMYKSEQRLSILFSIFSSLAIIVACLGLFGLVEYTVNQRTKEVSIRKVFGANVPSLVVLLNRRYFVLLVIACVLIMPLTYLAAGEWLSSFEYRIGISAMFFVKGILLMMAITAFTVSFQSIKTALTNPAEVLKNE